MKPTDITQPQLFFANGLTELGFSQKIYTSWSCSCYFVIVYLPLFHLESSTKLFQLHEPPDFYFLATIRNIKKTYILSGHLQTRCVLQAHCPSTSKILLPMALSGESCFGPLSEWGLSLYHLYIALYLRVFGFVCLTMARTSLLVQGRGKGCIQ